MIDKWLGMKHQYRTNGYLAAACISASCSGSYLPYSAKDFAELIKKGVSGYSTQPDKTVPTLNIFIQFKFFIFLKLVLGL